MPSRLSALTRSPPVDRGLAREGVRSVELEDADSILRWILGAAGFTDGFAERKQPGTEGLVAGFHDGLGDGFDGDRFFPEGQGHTSRR